MRQLVSEIVGSSVEVIGRAEMATLKIFLFALLLRELVGFWRHR